MICAMRRQARRAAQCFTSIVKRSVLLVSTMLINFEEHVTSHSPISRGRFLICKLAFKDTVQRDGSGQN
jgi:hypothetical protein